jgi:vancomycin resistance protein VanW
MLNSTVDKPINRSTLRRMAGKEYFILKRRLGWNVDGKNYASGISPEPLTHQSTQHQSFLLRPLKDVEMYLQHNKTTNLKLAISHINGLLIKPGQTFSFWKQVGRPTKQKGYLDGLTLENGKIGKGIGGGLCQLGNLLYWMALHTPLDVTERWRHSYDVFPDINRKIPFGSGATLSYNYIDLQLHNPTENTYQLNLWIDSEYLHGEIRCSKLTANTYEVFETDHSFKQQWWGGYTRHNKIWKRKINIADSTEELELVTVNHAIMMYNPLLTPPNPTLEGRA